MTQKEFESRVGMEVSVSEFNTINDMYMISDVDKDEFCALWAKMNFRRIEIAKGLKKLEEEKAELKLEVFHIYEKYSRMSEKEYNNAVTPFSVNALTKKEIAVLEKANIALTETHKCEITGWEHIVPKYLSTTIYDIMKYIGRC